MVKIGLLAFVLTVAILLECLLYVDSVQFQFKRYTYRKKRDDKRYRNIKNRCDTSPTCLSKFGIEQTICIRKCVSAVCYEELYGHDELEEGEIDVRLNSFKGCLAQQPDA
ncbi:hypothetical protein ScPMuIL_006818 [Solemya velum]